MTCTRTWTVALVGNPNAGKTTLFNALAGMRQRVGNYPGVTVEMTKGHCRSGDTELQIVDLPGTYSLAARSLDEAVAVDWLLGRVAGEPRPDVVVAVVDATNLDRHLYLVTQLCELGLPVVVALNMMDVARRNGVTIDVAQLSQNLGLPVVPIQANKSRGLDQLTNAIQQAAGSHDCPSAVPFPDTFERESDALTERLANLPAFMIRRLILDVGGQIEQHLVGERGESVHTELTSVRKRLAAVDCPVPAVEARTRYSWIRKATAKCVSRPVNPPDSTTDRIDRVVTHRLWGTLIFVALMALVFQSIFTAAVPPMEVIKSAKTWLASSVRGAMPAGPLTSLLADGIIEGVGSVVVFLPQILILFGFLAILEDCGYMARAAFLVDKLMSNAGLSGRSFIPLLSSVACAVPGIMATRVIEHPRDRLATILIAPLMSCSARLPVYALLTSAFLTEGHAWWAPGVTLLCLYMLGFLLAPAVAWTLKRTLLRGPTPTFVMEMPQYQWPSPKSVLLRMYDRAKSFLTRAGTFILASMVLVWALLYFPVHDANGLSYDVRLAEMRQRSDSLEGEPLQELRHQIDQLNGEWRRQSYLGRMGQWIEPVVTPLGWDWRIGMAAIASFPAREVVVGVLGQIYNLGQRDAEELTEPLGKALRQATWRDEPGGQPVFSVATAISMMVFFALCCQCASTLAVMKRETGSWKWPAFAFTYMTVLAYLGAFLVYQVGIRI